MSGGAGDGEPAGRGGRPSGHDPLAGAVFVTGNPGKLAEARRLAARPLESADLDLPEIQSLDLAEVLAAKADEAAHRVHGPFLVEETGLELAALDGFPGPLVKWMLRAVGAEGIQRTAAALGDDRATARCLLLHRADGRTTVGEGVVGGRLVPPRGEGGFGWDPVFLPAGSGRTYGEMAADEKDRISHRRLAWEALLARLAASVTD